MSDSARHAIEEPRLTTRRLRRRRVPRYVVALPLALDAKTASKSDFFKDPEVRRLLLRHGIRVDIHRLGSRGIATQSLKALDVVFPSGQPADKLVLDRQEGSVASVRPFVTPLVLGTFRGYAETLVKAGVAEPQQSDGGGDTLRERGELTLNPIAIFL
ncbi:hypothetical protein ABZ464_39885 [Streptomyces sp. NPDC005820]|uniref:hypothetical protein n=1 Tax=Streptomyces sp. NPDC005820 TaxID=3157069 RepID=UPI0034104DD4